MLSAAFLLLSVTVALGIALGLLHLRSERRWPWTGALHGLCGITGLVLLLTALRGPPRGMQAGVASFGAVAAVLAAVALTLGLGAAILQRHSRGLAGVVLAGHATLAVTCYLLLAAYVALG